MGDVFMLDSVRVSLGVALLELGYSMNERDEAKVEEAKRKLAAKAEKRKNKK